MLLSITALDRYALHKEYLGARRKNANNYDYNTNSILFRKNSLPSNCLSEQNCLVATSTAFIPCISNSARIEKFIKVNGSVSLQIGSQKQPP